MKLNIKAALEMDSLGKIILAVFLLIVLLAIIAYISGQFSGQEEKVGKIFGMIGG